MIAPYQWHVFDKVNPSVKLKDHYWYLVICKDYKTPMKAKWHDGVDSHWEIIIGYGKPNEIVYTWDEDCKVIGYLELPTVI